MRSPRVTKPYTDEQWESIEPLGQRDRRELSAGDVRLTMGGEPTFVSRRRSRRRRMEYRRAGPRKRADRGRAAEAAARAFRARAACSITARANGIPGEPLPRWALGCFWRTDGEPIWSDASLVANEAKDYGCGAKEARELHRAADELLGVDPR